jgi:dienelactone hydrolase
VKSSRPKQTPRKLVLEVTPRETLVDRPLLIRASGCEPGQPLTIRARMGEHDSLWESHAVFVARPDGTVDASVQAPVSGSYQGADPMGLVWSMALNPTALDKYRRGELQLVADQRVARRFVAESAAASSATVETLAHHALPPIVYTALRREGIVGSLFHRPGTPRPAVINVSGSGGGIDGMTGALLASHGYTALSLGYFGVEGLPADLADIPLEYFGNAIEWLRRHPDVKRGPVGVIGWSRGGELALLLGATFPEIGAVVGYVPSGVAWSGIGRDPSTGVRPAWTRHGQPVPFVPPAPPERFAESARFIGGALHLVDVFRASMRVRAMAERAEIAVERINGPLLMVSGEDDALWPSSELAEIAMARLKRSGFTHRHEHLRFKGAGHAIRVPYQPTTLNDVVHPLTRQMLALGGNPRDNAAASVKAWQRALALFDEALGA